MTASARPEEDYLKSYLSQKAAPEPPSAPAPEVGGEPEQEPQGLSSINGKPVVSGGESLGLGDGFQYKPHFDPTSKVAVETPDGDTIFVRGKNVEKAKAMGGKVVASDQVAGYESPDEKFQDQWGGFEKGAAFSTRFAEELPMGLGKVVEKMALSPEDLQTLKDVQQKESGWASAGGIAGIGTQIGLTMGLGSLTGAAKAAAASTEAADGIVSAGRAASFVQKLEGGIAKTLAAPALATEGLGHMAGQKALGLLAETGLSSAAKHVTEQAVNSAVQGALYSTVNGISEDVFEDHDITAQKLLGYAGTGGLVGGVLGGALGGIGMLLKPGAEKAAIAVSDAADAQGSALNKKLSSMKGRLAFESLKPNVADVRKLGRTFEKQIAGAEEIGNAVLEKGIDTNNAPKALKIIKSEMETVGKNYDKVWQTLDTKSTIRIDTKAFMEKAATEILGPLHESPRWNADAIRQVEGGMQDLSELMGGIGHQPSFQEVNTALQKFKKGMTKSLWERAGKAGAAPLTTAEESILDLERLLKAERMSVGEAAAEQAGGSNLKGVLQQQDKAWSTLRRLEDIFNRKATKEVSLQKFGLGDKLSAAGGAAAFGPAGLAMGFVNKALREKGNLYAAKAIDKIQALTGIREATVKFSDITTKAANAFVHGVEEHGPAAVVQEIGHVAGHGLQHTAVHKALTAFREEGEHGASEAAHSVEDEIASVQNLSQNPNALADKVTAATEGLHGVAPQIAGAASGQLTGHIMYLSQNLPHPMGGDDPLDPDAKPRYAQADLDKFARKLAVAKNPMVAMQAMLDHSLTQDHVQALGAMWPALLDEMKAQTVTSLTEATSQGKKLPYAKRLQLGTLMGIPADKSLAPGFIQALQGTKQGGQEAPKPPQQASGGQHGSTKMKRDQFATQGDRIEGGIRG